MHYLKPVALKASQNIILEKCCSSFSTSVRGTLREKEVAVFTGKGLE